MSIQNCNFGYNYCVSRGVIVSVNGYYNKETHMVDNDQLCYEEIFHDKLAPFMKIASHGKDIFYDIAIVDINVNQKFIYDMTSLVNLKRVYTVAFSSCIFHKDLKVLDLRRFGEIFHLVFDHCNISFDEVLTHNNTVKLFSFYSSCKNGGPVDIKFPSTIDRVDLINTKITNRSFDSITSNHEIVDSKIGDGDFCCDLESPLPSKEHVCVQNPEYMCERKIDRSFFVDRDGTYVHY